MARQQRSRYHVNLQNTNRPGHSVYSTDDMESAMSQANILRRDYLKAGVRVTVYDSERGYNVYDYTVE
jgi:hypothetical protein